GNLGLEAGLRDGRAVPARAAVELDSSTVGSLSAGQPVRGSQSGHWAAVITAWAYSASRSSSWPRICARKGKSDGETRRRANGLTGTGLANWGTRAVPPAYGPGGCSTKLS